MKKLIIFVTTVFICFASFANVASADAPKGKRSLTIYNCADYIDEELITVFEEEYDCEVNYYTYDTNETMYNQFTLQPLGTYDLICASDYILQRMIREGLIEKLDTVNDTPVYNEYASKEVRSKLASMMVDTDGDKVKDSSLDNYVAGYMWGTLGIVYNVDASDTIREDVKSWNVFWDENYENVISIKNSMRDTYVVGLMHAYNGSNEEIEDLLTPARNLYYEEVEQATSQAEVDLAVAKYNKVIQDLFDALLLKDDYKSVLNIVKEELLSLKENIFGFEVDSGKNDIITQKILMNLAWSGDAVYSIETAYDADVILEYAVPLEGSNVWYDGMVVPKGGNKELACEFIDFISDPANAAQNMEYIGYTSFIASDDVFSLISDWYGVAEYFEGRGYYAENLEEEVEASYVIYNDEYYMCIKDAEPGILPTNEEYFEKLSDEDIEDLGLGEPYDISYFFDGLITAGRKAVIYPWEDWANSLETQYPSLDILARCAIMNDFEHVNDDVIIMWGQVKAHTNMMPYYIILSVVIIIGGVATSVSIIKKKQSSRNKRRLANLK